MIKRYIVSVLFCCICYMTAQCSSIAESIRIRLATKDDLEAALRLDHQITFEFFKPLYTNYYAHLPQGKDPDQFLSYELAADEKYFLECLDDTSPRRLLIAQDLETGTLAGFLLFHRENKMIELDLLLIDKQYRHMGIGKKLICMALTVFNGIDGCTAYPLRFGNDNKLKFYESLGFVREASDISEKSDLYGISYDETRYFYKLDVSQN